MGETLTELADRAASLLAEPVDDPMSPEWVVVPTAGVDRWLRLRLAERLGTSGEGATDGVAANIEMLFPGRLRHRILVPGDADAADPWDVDRLTWIVLDVLSRTDPDPLVAQVAKLPEGASLWSRSRGIADLFDRYLLHRPSMVAAWEAGEDVDAWGQPLPVRTLWQPRLWRAVQQRIARPSPAVTLPALLGAISSGRCPPEVPPRITLYGLTTVPGGHPFVELLEALGHHRQVNLLLHQPSLAMARSVQRSLPDTARTLLRRGDDALDEEVGHPLLRSWARPAREALTLLGKAVRTSSEPPPPVLGSRGSQGSLFEPAPTLLGELQSDVREDRRPRGLLRCAPDDRSIRIHSCHGPSRQVEVLRDQILHLLADDPTLSEDDIVVLCPALDQFAPLIEARWGDSAVTTSGDDPRRAAALAYRIADRSLSTTTPLLAALASVVELADSRFSDSAILDIASLGAVRQRYGFDDEAIRQLADWVEDANTCWGIDGEHRSRWGIPATLDDGSWSTVIDRLMLGALISDHLAGLGPGDVLPIEVEGHQVSLAGRFADLLSRLVAFERAAQTPRPVRGWVDVLAQLSSEVFATDRDDSWQESRLADVLARIADSAELDGTPSEVPLSVGDLRALLGRHLRTSAGRVDFFRGGITVSSLTPLRGVPHRVVCLLGLDEAAFATPPADGDDLTAIVPALGDRDRRSETRQSLLDAILSARDHLIITRTGHNVVTNQEVPPSVALSELGDAIAATIHPDDRERAMAAVEITHPRQSYDERNFVPGRVDPGSLRPWSFDRLAHEGATRRGGERGDPALITEPLELDPPQVVELAELHDFLDEPVRYFLADRLEVFIPRDPEREGGRLVAPSTGATGAPRASTGRDLRVDIGYLDQWKLADRLMGHVRSGTLTGDDLREVFARREEAADFLPAGQFADAEIEEAFARVDPIVANLTTLGLGSVPVREPEHLSVDVTLPSGVRVVGSVRDDGGHEPGPVNVAVSRYKPHRKVSPWLDMVAATAADPHRPWRSVLLTRPANKSARNQVKEDVLRFPDDDPTIRRDRAVAALQLVVELFTLGRREPLPIFKETSAALGCGKNARGAWHSSSSFSNGESENRWGRLAFGEMTFDQLIDIPCRPDDPEGDDTSRAVRLAKLLWNAIEGSSEAVATS